MLHLSNVDMLSAQRDLPHGTLDLLVLKTLETMGPLHGYSLARRIEQVADKTMRLSQGSIYPALMRLEQERLIRTKWGVSETSRQVKFYAITAAGTKALARAVEKWQQSTALVARFLEEKS
jgi:PadR family transcriptional regulator PadR